MKNEPLIIHDDEGNTLTIPPVSQAEKGQGHVNRLNQSAFDIACILSHSNPADREEVLKKTALMLQNDALLDLMQLYGWRGFWRYLCSHWWLVPLFTAVGAFLGHLLVSAYPIPC